VDHAAVERAVLLERVGDELDAGGLARLHEARVLVTYEHLGDELLARGDDGDQRRPGGDHGAGAVRRDVLDGAGVRGAQLDAVGAQELPRERLGRARDLAFGLGALGVQLRAVARHELREASLRLDARGVEAGDDVALRREVLRLLDVLALALERREVAHEPFGAQLRVTLGGRAHDRHDALELALGRARGGELLASRSAAAVSWPTASRCARRFA
jgi:hypothetical protein